MCNYMLGKEPKKLLASKQAFTVGYPRLPPPNKTVNKNPTLCKELVTCWPNYIGVKDASSRRIGSIIMGKGKSCIPTVFRVAWPYDIKELFRKGDITNLDLEIAGLIMLWIVIEEVCP